MKKTLLLGYFLFVMRPMAAAQPSIDFVNSKITSHFLFIINAADGAESVRGYVAYIKENVPASDPFWQAIQEYQKIEWNFKEFNYPDAPEDLLSARTNVKDRIFKLSLIARDYEDFFFLAAGFFSYEEFQILKNSFLKTRDIFEKWYWTPLAGKNDERVKEFSQYGDFFQKWISLISRFYGHPEPPSMRMAVYTIPGDKRYTKSFAPVGQIAMIGLGIKVADLHDFLGVIVHEVAHEIEGSRPLSKSQEISNYITQIDTYEAARAHSFLGEAIPCALGNALAYEDIAQKPYDQEYLYNDPIIRYYGNAMYGLCKEYVQEEKEIDSIFMRKAVAIFNKTIPDIRYEKADLLFNLRVFFENKAGMDWGWLRYQLRSNFKGIYSLYSEAGFEKVRPGSNMTHMFVIHRDQATHYARINQKLGNIFPTDLDLSREYVLFSPGKETAPVFLLILQNADKLESVMQAFAGLEEFKPQKNGILLELN